MKGNRKPRGWRSFLQNETEILIIIQLKMKLSSGIVGF